MFCQNCGTELLNGAHFCPNCGTKIINDNAGGQPHVGVTQSHEKDAASNQSKIDVAPPREDAYAENNYTAHKSREQQSERVRTEDEPQSMRGHDENLLMRSYLLGSVSSDALTKPVEHYIKAFEKFTNGTSKANWNWAAFFFGGWNLMYRKSYMWGILIEVASWIFTGATAGIGLVTALVRGVFLDYIHYMRYTQMRSQAQAAHPNDIGKQCEYVATAGGVNKAIIAICIVCSILCAVFVAALVAVGIFAFGKMFNFSGNVFDGFKRFDL